MTIGAIDESQRKATVVGFSYLFALPPAIFAEFYVRSHLIAFDNVAQTAQNVMTHGRLFRLGIASNLTVFALDVVLIMALCVVLMPVNRSLALLATGWGLIETATLVVVTLSDLEVLRILSGADYLHAFEANQLQAWRDCRSVRMPIRITSAWCSPGFEVLPSAICGSSLASFQKHWRDGEWLRRF